MTDAAGRFTLQGLAPGRYDITAWAEDKGKAELKDIDIAVAGPLRLVIDHSARAVLTGTVVGLREMPDGRSAMVMVRVVGTEGRARWRWSTRRASSASRTLPRDASPPPRRRCHPWGRGRARATS